MTITELIDKHAAPYVTRELGWSKEDVESDFVNFAIELLGFVNFEANQEFQHGSFTHVDFARREVIKKVLEELEGR